MSSKSIFQQTHAPRTSRLVPMFDGAMTSAHSNLAIGRVCGSNREVMAVVSPTATDDDVWRVVNLKSKGGDTDQFDSIAVLGAIDDDQAVEWAFNQRGRFLLDGIVLSVGETNTPGLKRYLDSERLNYRENSPIHLNQLAKLQDMTTGQPVLWDGINLKSHSSSSAVLLVDLVKHDDHSQLFDAIKADDMPALLELLGAEVMGYDALIVESRKLDTLMQRLGAAMSKATEAGVTVTNVRQSEPFKRNKVTQVAAIFEMSDGQSVSIVFHNPDSTPSKLLPQDTLISWKFLLNSRDISAAVQPNQGEDVQLPVLATRMMKLVNQNSARFARTNAKKAENVAALDEAKARIETKSQTVAALDVEIAQLQAELDKPVEPKSDPDLPPIIDTEGFESDESAGTWFSANSRHIGNPQSLRHEAIKSRSIANIDAILRGLDLAAAEYQQKLVDVRSGKIVGSKIVGSGYGRNTKSVAIEWLEEQIQRNAKMIELANSLKGAPQPSIEPTPAVEPATIIASEQAMIQELQELLVSAGWTKDPKREQPFFYSPDFLFQLGISNNARLKVPSYLQILYLPPNSKEILSLPDAGGDLNFGAYSEQPEATAKDLMAFVDAEIQKAKLSINPTPAVEPEPLTTQQRNEQAFAGVKAVLVNDYGWKPTHEYGLEKTFTGLQAAGEVNPNGEVTLFIETNGPMISAKSPNGMDQPIFIATEYLLQYKLNDEAYRATAEKLVTAIDNSNRAVRKYLQEKQSPAVEPEPTTTDLGNNESVSRGMANNGDGTFTAMTATQSKTFKTRAGAERWLAQRGLNPDGSKIEVAEPEPAPAPTPEEAPMPATNPDAEYLQSIVDGTADLSVAGDELERIGDNLPPELEALFEEAAEAYAQYAIGLEV